MRCYDKLNIQSEKEIPTQLVPNTAYYIIGKEVRIIDNLGQTTK